MKYKRKPIIVEAVKWIGIREPLQEPMWLTDAFAKGIVKICKDDFEKFPPYIEITSAVPNADELHTASLGDYIVRGAFGEIYSCRASIFEHDHESVLK